MKIENLEVGKTYKNFKELCEVLEVKYPPTTKTKEVFLKKLKEKVKIIRSKRTIKIVGFYKIGEIQIEKKCDKKFNKLMKKIILHLVTNNKWTSEKDFLKNFCIENEYVRDIWRRTSVICGFLDFDRDFVLCFDNQLANVKNQAKIIKDKIDEDLEIYQGVNIDIEDVEIEMLKSKVKVYLKENMSKKFKGDEHKRNIKKILKLYFTDNYYHCELLNFSEEIKEKEKERRKGSLVHEMNINSKGRYTLLSASKRKDEFEKIRAIVYKIECWDDYESFYKIGITSLTTKERFDVFDIPYKYRIIDEIHTNLYEAILLENKLHEENNEYKYLPKKDFGGKTECFNNIKDFYGKV